MGTLMRVTASSGHELVVDVQPQHVSHPYEAVRYGTPVAVKNTDGWQIHGRSAAPQEVDAILSIPHFDYE